MPATLVDYERRDNHALTQQTILRLETLSRTSFLLFFAIFYSIVAVYIVDIILWYRSVGGGEGAHQALCPSGVKEGPFWTRFPRRPRWPQ